MWNELLDKRNRYSRTYADGNQRRVSVALGSIHYQAVLDSGIYDAEIDTTPVRVTNTQLDGWTITDNGWHYALGQPAGQADGWVGFGGRQGQNWFKFRLARVGFLRWSTRELWDIGGNPTYNRSRLTQQTNSLTIGPLDEPLIVETTATWSRIWSTPSGGQIDVSWKVRSEQIKEEITINQVGREWIAANRNPLTHWPGSTLDDIYFGFVFQLDWSDIPKVIRQGIQQDIDSDFADDGEGIELTDALDRLLAFLPLSDVRVDALKPESVPLRKRFYKDGSDYYLVLGVRCDLLNVMPTGDLIFDPTINEQVGTANDDGFESNNHWYSYGIWFGTYGGNDHIACTRFQTVNVPQGATISDATYTLTEKWDEGGSYMVYAKVRAEDIDDANQPSSSNKPSGMTPTTAGTDLDGDAIDWVDNQITEVDVTDVIQEIVDRGSWLANNDINILIYNDGTTGNHDLGPYDYSHDSSKAAKLDITYSTSTLYYQSAAGDLSFSGNLTKKTPKGVAGGVSFSGDVLKATAKVLSGALSFAGNISRSTSKILGGVLSFASSIAKKSTSGLSGILSFSGTVSKKTSNALSGVLSFVGNVSKKTSISITGTLDFSGDLATQGLFKHSLDGVLSFVGDIQKKASLSLSGSLSFVGNLKKKISTGVAGTLSFAGNVAKQTAVSLVGALSFVGDLTAKSKFTKALSGGLSFVGGVTKLPKKYLGGAISPTGTVVKLTKKFFAGALSFGGSVVKSMQIALSGTLSFSGNVARSTNKQLAGAVSFSGDIGKKTSKIITGAVSFVGELTPTKLSNVYQKALSGTLSFTGDVSKLPKKMLSGTLDSTGTLVKKTAKNLSGILSFIGTPASLHKAFASLAGTLSFVGDVSKDTKKSFSGTLSFSGDVIKKVYKTLAGDLSFVGSEAGHKIGTTYYKSVAGILSFGGDISPKTKKGLAGALSFAGNVVSVYTAGSGVPVSLQDQGGGHRRRIDPRIQEMVLRNLFQDIKEEEDREIFEIIEVLDILEE